MPNFTYTFTVKAPLADVARFHHDARALKRLTPPPIFVQLHRVDPLAEGAVADFTLWMGPLPIRWVAVHSDVSDRNGFTDTQQRGPFRRWRHTHRFESVEAGEAEVTRVSEDVEYEYPVGVAGVFARLLFSPPSLRFLFWYRSWVTRRALEVR